MISIPGSLSFAKLMMMSSAPAKSAEDAGYTSQDPFTQSTLSDTISTSICFRSAFQFLRRAQRGDGKCKNTGRTAACLTFADSSLIPFNSSSLAL